MRSVASALLSTLRASRLGQALVFVLVLHVTALFSLLPFGQPVIAPLSHSAAAIAHGHQVSSATDGISLYGATDGIPSYSATDGIPLYGPDDGILVGTSDHAECVESGGSDSAWRSAAISGCVVGSRLETDPDPVGLMSAEAELFAGLRACASLPAASARLVMLAPQRRLHPRAPPAAA